MLQDGLHSKQMEASTHRKLETVEKVDRRDDVLVASSRNRYKNDPRAMKYAALAHIIKDHERAVTCPLIERCSRFVFHRQNTHRIANN